MASIVKNSRRESRRGYPTLAAADPPPLALRRAIELYRWMALSQLALISIMSKQNPTDPKDIFIQKSKSRFFKGLDYLTLFIYVVVVSVCALLADYIIILAIEFTVASDISSYPIVSQAFDWFKIGSAFLVLIAAAVHAFFSAWSQIKFEIETAREPILESTTND